MLDTPEGRYRQSYGSRMEKELKLPRRSFASSFGKACLILICIALYIAFAVGVLVAPNRGF